MPKQGFITLYFDAEGFASEMGDGSKLDDAMLFSFGKDMNEQAAHLLGYEGWVSGWNNLPDKVLTGGDYTDQAMALARTAYCNLTVNKEGKLTGIVCDKVSGTELDVGQRLDGQGVERFYANDDEGVYYYGDTLAAALSLAFDAQRQF